MSITMPGPFKHPSTGTYYLKQRVPADLAKIVKGTTVALPVDATTFSVKIGDQVKVSLRTRDPRLAKERHREADDALSLHWKALRSTPTELTTRQRLALAGEAYGQLTARFDEEPFHPDHWKRVIHLCVLATQTEGNPSDALDPDARDDLEAFVGKAADALLSRRGLRLSRRSRDQLLFEIALALAAAATDIMRKAEGDYSETGTAKRYPVWPISAAQALPPAERQTISGLFVLWREDRARNGGAESSARRWKRPIDAFIAFLGHDDAQAVTPQDVIRWKNAIGEAGEVAPSTFNKVHFAAVKAIFSHGVNNLILASNPVLGIKSRAPKAQQTRPLGFTQEEAEKILTAANGALTAPGGMGEVLRQALRWVPWLCAYSGARVGEMAQLRKEDVLIIDGIECLRITPEAGTVKTGYFRDVPIHSHLIDMGFLDFVGGHTSGPLFYAAGRSASASPWTTTMGRLSDWVRKTAGVTDTRVAPSHGWRHRFTAVADEVGIDPKFSRAIGGWSAGSQGDRYGHRSVKTLKREIERLPRYEV